jgi:acyl dehydratase
VELTSFAVPPDRRFFEDYTAGRAYDLGTTTVSESQIIEFAKQFDPQPFHLDPAKATATQFRGIIASGWHTIGLAMRLYVDQFLSHVASQGSPGVEDIRWPSPLRPGDRMRVRATILETRPSRSKPDRGVVRARIEASNQMDDLVLSMVVVSLLGCRQKSSVPSG